MNMHLSRLFSRFGAALAVLCMIPVASAQCTIVKTHSGANFGGGSFVVQAGFAEQEAAAASYTLDPGSFPVKLNLMEMVFATYQATVLTTTEWQVFVYEGTPATGTQIFSYDSNDVDIPYIRCGPGTAGVNVQFSIDPNDPEQIIINDNGSHTFSVGYRILAHNNPPIINILAPDRYTNCFPTTDADGLSQPTQNWLDSIDIGTFGAPGGWHSFSQLPVSYRPTGDWNIRATYTSVNPVTITSDPQDLMVSLGQTAYFDIEASGPNLQYQWYRGTTSLSNSTNHIYGATSPNLQIRNTVTGDAGRYSCVVSNTCGSVTSNSATLSFPGGTMTGHLTLLDFVGAPAGRQFVMQIKPAGSPTVLATVNATLDAGSNYSVVLPGTVVAGNYDIFCDGQHWLGKKRASVAVTGSGASGVNFSLFNGDADNSGEVDAADIDAVIADFSGSGVMTDLDGSLEVDAADIDIAIANFGRVND